MLNFQALGWQPQPLQYLEAPFSEQEVARLIKEMPQEKAP
jgi:hypothetical protein